LGIPGIVLAKALGGDFLAVFLEGVLLSSIFWGFREIVTQESGAAWRSRGAEGESLTAKELKRRVRGQVIHGLKFGKFDVDHVLVSPSGIFAVESKATAEGTDFDPTRLSGRALAFLENARRGADRVELFLTRQAGLDVDVVPLLVVWGDKVSVLGGFTKHEDAWVINGPELGRWAAQLPSDVVESWTADAAYDALRNQEMIQVRRAPDS
jgi:hypothetical protein